MEVVVCLPARIIWALSYNMHSECHAQSNTPGFLLIARLVLGQAATREETGAAASVRGGGVDNLFDRKRQYGHNIITDRPVPQPKQLQGRQ